MKKNISINISGIIFHIEEDGYDKLKNYLDSINRYFSTFDDSHEIIADIEGRIAEIFLSKLKDGRQVISLEDVDSLIATMGSVKDFQAAEEEATFTTEEKSSKEQKQKTFEAPPVSEPRRIYRDGRRKILGGVLSGLAHYFNIDPLWIRLIYLLLFFGISVIESIGPALFILYIALWIIFPVSYDLEEEEKLRKMYRDPDNKVLGGVCGGIAAYFGVDVIIIRLLFFISIFFVGTGVILYIILWLILPEAITITDKMKMKGQPVTLSNIEMNIKKSFNVNEGEENVFVKILLFPFRLIAMLFDFLSKAIGPLAKFLVDAVRIFIGAIITLVGVALILSAIFALATVLGMGSPEFAHFNKIPLILLGNDLSWWHVTALFFALLIPFIFIVILGLITITKRKMLTPTIGWSLMGLWIISTAVVAFKIPALVSDFSSEGYHTVENVYDVSNKKTLVLKLRDAGEDFYETVDLEIKDSEDGKLKIVEEFKARGYDMFSGEQNAQMVDYSIEQKDSVFNFDSNLSFKNNAKFRVQELYVSMYIPERQKFIVDNELSYLLGNYFRRKGFSTFDLKNKTWFFENGELRCEGCATERTSRRRERQTREEEQTSLSEKTFPFDNFSVLEIEGEFKIKVTEADEFSILVKSDEKELNRIVVDKNGNSLNIHNAGRSFRTVQDLAYVEILMPKLKSMSLKGASNATVYGFTSDDLDLETSETAVVDFDGNVDRLHVLAKGSSVVTLFGKGDELDAQTENAAKINAFDYYVDTATAEASGASEIKIYGEDRMKVTATDGSKIIYRGNARIEIDRKDRATVEKE